MQQVQCIYCMALYIRTCQLSHAKRWPVMVFSVSISYIWNMKHLLLSFALVSTFSLSAQVLINEAATSNFNTLIDEDSDHPDWFELYNAGAAAVNLNGYSVGTSKQATSQWHFADTILQPGDHVIVYASGKNRNYLGEPEGPVDHWETAVFADDIWEYKSGNSAPGAGWNNVGFAGVWSTGMGGFGYGDGDDATVTASGKSFYYRKSFNIVDKSKILKTILSMDYDDGYIVYINGVEVNRKNITGTPTYLSWANYWHEALMYLGLPPIEIELDSALMSTTLVNGENVIAVEVHQYNSDDGTGKTWLHFGITTPDIFFYDNPTWFNNPGTATQLHTSFSISNGESLYLMHDGIVTDSIENLNLQTGHVRSRIPDGGSWCYSETPTPGAANTGTCYDGYAVAPVITTAPGFYTGSVDVNITGGEVHYTTDGSTPTAGDALYGAPVNFSNTGVIKAVQVEAGKLPSAIATGSYFIDEPTLLPVVSVIGDPCDLFDLGPDCIGAYDNSEGWFNHNPKISVTMQYFDSSHVERISNQFKFECVGNYSISLPQKSMRFVIDEDYGSGPEPTYNLFWHDKPYLEQVHGFRVRNSDQDYYGTRMKDIVINRIGNPTYCVSTGYQNAAVFVNGEYWGMMGAREEMDEYFLRDNFGIDPEKVDMMKTGWGGEEFTMAEVGSDTAFRRMVDFILNNDMSDDANYAKALTMADVNNWVDYFSTGIFTDNSEWFDLLENNIRLFRSYDPDIKWRYMLWDCTNSQFSSNENMLSGTLNNPWNSVYVSMFNALLENPTFHDYFIDRFADLINYVFTVDFNEGIVDELKAEMGTEIPAQNIRWGSGSYASWNSSVNALYTFYDNRNVNQRNHIKSYFGLAGQVNVTLDVNPPGAGYVQISTITPSTLPWTGVYFNGVPVKLTAIANPGYEFVNWDDNAFIVDPSQISFTNNITTATTFVANFNGSPIDNPIVISEINYNSDSTHNSGDWIELHNTAAVPMNISNYVLSGKYYYSDFAIPANTIIPANGYLVLAEDTLKFMAEHPGVSNVMGDYHFTFDNDGDSITLRDFVGNDVQVFRFDDVRPWPFTADGYGRTMELKDDPLNPALPGTWFEGCVGGSPGVAFSPCNEDPLIDEINYNSSAAADAGDWFEIYNYGSMSFDLSNWQLKDKHGNVFIIPEGTVLDADSYLAFYQNETKFNDQFPSVTNKLGPVDFGFDGNGDVILLYDTDGILFQSVGFDDAAPYPLAPDGGGVTLQLNDVVLNLNDPSNWISSCPEGTPGSAYVLPCATGIDLPALADLSVYPNPAGDVIHINAGDAVIASAEVANAQGIVVLHSTGNFANAINIQTLAAGIYTLRIQTESGATGIRSFVKL